MIVVFVVDTSPSMGLPVSLSSLSDSQNHNDTEGNKMRGMSRLDLAKMTVVSRQSSHVMSCPGTNISMING